MPLKEQIQEVLASDYRGPKAAYGEVDILKASLQLASQKRTWGAPD